jgi:dienelactone hydrolase
MYKSDEVYKYLIKSIKHPVADKSFLNDQYSDFEKWSTETRAWVKSRLSYEPDEVSFDPVVTEEVDFGSYTRKKLYFYTAQDCKVPAYLLIPKNLKSPAPAIVALHDHSGMYYYGKEKIVDHKEELATLDWFHEYRYGGRGYASALAEEGYVVIVIDAVGFGERGPLTETWLKIIPSDFGNAKKGTEDYIRQYDKFWGERMAWLHDAVLYAGYTFLGLMVWDDIRTVDFLCTLPEVDKNRIGCIGLSMGGYRSVWLGAVDERIKCCCTIGWMAKMDDLAPFRCPSAWLVPGLYNRLPYPDLASLVAPRNLFVQYCENDQLFDLSTMVDACRTIQKVYKKAGCTENFESKGYPVGHMFNYEMQEDAFVFLKGNL